LFKIDVHTTLKDKLKKFESKDQSLGKDFLMTLKKYIQILNN